MREMELMGRDDGVWQLSLTQEAAGRILPINLWARTKSQKIVIL